MCIVKQITIILLITQSLTSNTLAIATPISPEKIKTEPAVLTGEIKTYAISSNEQITLLGTTNKNWITTNWYWGEAGYGAIIGKRSGFLEGGIVSGIQQPINRELNLTLQLFTGAGGGGSAPQGGGLIINPTIGIAYQMTQYIIIGINLGYIKFLNGDIQSPTFSFNINFPYNRVTYQND